MSKRALWWLVVLLAILGLVLAACGDKNEKESSTSAAYKILSVQNAYAQLSKSSSALIVDVRDPGEWAATGILAGAVLIPLPEIAQRAPNELPKDKEIYVICNTGNRSRVAAQILIRSGYQNVISIDGGIQAWLRAGLPTEPYTP
jgi:rhodanese-related sulfurtransferase